MPQVQKRKGVHGVATTHTGLSWNRILAIFDVKILVESESLLTGTEIYINPWEHMGTNSCPTISPGILP